MQPPKRDPTALVMAIVLVGLLLFLYLGDTRFESCEKYKGNNWDYNYCLGK